MIELTSSYKSVKRDRKISLRSLVRHIGLELLSKGVHMNTSMEKFKTPRIQFLYLHHVFDDEVVNFEKLILELSKHHTFIGYSEAVDRIINNNIDKPYISISSDDGFKNNRNAVEVMNKYDIKGCFFINPDTIGLNGLIDIEKFCRDRLQFPPTEFMNWNDIHELLKNGHEIGSHTMGHINISETNYREVEENIHRSYEELESRCGVVKHFAFPYGRYFHFNQHAFNTVFKAGFKSCASAERGCHFTMDRSIKPNELMIRRDHVICDWDIDHTLFFLLRNLRNPTNPMQLNPYI